MARRKTRPSPAQLAARAKFAAAARAGKWTRRAKRAVKRGARKLARKTVAATRTFRRTNPVTGRFQVAGLRKGSVLFYTGIGMSNNRDAAANFVSVKSARHVAKALKDVVPALQFTKLAVITSHDTPAEIRRFLLGEAPRAAGKTR